LKRKPKSKISLLCSAGTDTIGIRVPANAIALKLLSMIPFPLAAPSANKSTKLSPTNATDVSESLKENGNLTILDGGQCEIGVESTIIDCSGDKLCILRPGAISEKEILEECNLPLSKINKLHNSSDKLKHYTTQKSIILNVSSINKDDALLAFGKPIENQCKYILNLSEKCDLTEAAANLFKMLHELDKTNAARICVMPIPSTGAGIAINDRLLKASRR
jgi:L-threonylcarbamoyladenylate synthase